MLSVEDLQLVLQIISNAPIQGTFEQVERATDRLRLLRANTIHALNEMKAAQAPVPPPDGDPAPVPVASE